jgi:hypothetical protein
MNWRDEIRRYEEDAEDRFDNFDEEYEEFDGEEDDSYYEEYEYYPEEYDNYSNTAVGRIDPNDRTYTVTVKNTGTSDAEAIIFGANEGAAQATGVTVTVEESSHNEVREESKSNPFKILGMKMSVTDRTQFDHVLRIVRRTSSGSNTSRVYQPRNASSPQNFDKEFIDDANFEMDVTGQDSIRFNIKAGVTAVFTFTIKARANMGNLLSGHNVAEVSTTPRTTGLPQLDLMMGNRPRTMALPTPVKASMPVRKVVRKAAPPKVVKKDGRFFKLFKKK